MSLEGLTAKAAAWRSNVPGLVEKVVMLVAIAVLVTMGVRGLKQANEWRARASEQERVMSVTNRWRSNFVRPTPAESIAWARTPISARTLGVPAAGGLYLLRQLSGVAEDAGLDDVRVQFGPPDTTSGLSRPSIGNVTFQMAPYSIVVEFRGSIEGSARFVGALPPSISIRQVSLLTGADALSRILLVVYERVNTDGS